MAAERIFLSYSSEDYGPAIGAMRHVSRARTRSIFAPRSLRGGDKWAPGLKEELGRADKVLLLWTRKAAAAKWVKWELSVARSLEKAIIPIVAEDIPLPAWISEYHSVDAVPLINGL